MNMKLCTKSTHLSKTLHYYKRVIKYTNNSKLRVCTVTWLIDIQILNKLNMHGGIHF